MNEDGLRDKNITFKQWIIQKRNLNSPRGDLANDIYNDINFPNTYSYSEIISYLKYKNACKQALDTFKSAYKTFKRLSES